MSNTAALLLASAIVYAATVLAPAPYEMIGATPRGVAIFNRVSGDTEVRQPLPFPSTTTTTLPGEPTAYRQEV